MSDPTAGLAGEAAKALGRIGDRQATPALIGLLADPSERYAREDRILAIRALGRMGGSDAADALLGVLEEWTAEERGARGGEGGGGAGMGQIGDARAAPVLAALLQREDVPRPLRLALVRALGELGHASGAAALRAILPAAVEDGVLFPLLADALARLSDRESIRPLLDGIGRQDSPVGRRQAAHAVGALLGEGDALYALLGQEAFARDAALARMVDDLQKQMRSVKGAEGLSAALDAYLREDYVACTARLASVARAVQASLRRIRPPAAIACCEAVQQIARFDPGAMSVELVLLAWCALRGCVAA